MTILPTRTSSPSLLIVARGIAGAREEIVARWGSWLATRPGAAQGLDAATTERLVRLIVDLLVLMVGPLRREVDGTWFAASELYGRLAALRGLSAGEVVEELQHLREVLARELADFFVALPARQQLPTVLRINRVVDTGVAGAVVGYTDALVATMFGKEGVPVPIADSFQEAVAQIEGLAAEARLLAGRSPR